LIRLYPSTRSLPNGTTSLSRVEDHKRTLQCESATRVTPLLVRAEYDSLGGVGVDDVVGRTPAADARRHENAPDADFERATDG
jgi:hypothetical protein